MNLAQKLEEVYRIKKDIKDALESRGIPFVSDVFATYADLIRQLPKYVLGKWSYGHLWSSDRKWTYNK